MTEGTVDTPQTTRRKIIERPRLTRLLDESPARIKMLIAPAGYGKTTLARQWLTAMSPVAWCVCRPSSRDVASLAASVSASLEACSSFPGIRLMQRLETSGRPDQDATILANLIAQDAVAWGGGWLVIDDYHEIAGVAAAEAFVFALANAEVFSVLVCSRERPVWATAREILYGEIQELDRGALSFEDGEAESVLGNHRAESRTVIDAAGGWPALIGLAAMTRGGAVAPNALPQALYDFFAETVFEAIDVATAAKLSCLASMPSLTRVRLEQTFGIEQTQILVDVGLRLGILSEVLPNNEYDLHPLLRQFMFRRETPKEAASRQCFLDDLLASFISSEAWDEASVVGVSRGPDGAGHLLEAGLEELLRLGRVATVKECLAIRERAGVHAPIDTLAAAEVSFREGHYREAQHLATVAASELPSSSPRYSYALLVAGRSAHLASSEAVALRLFREAGASALDDELRIRASWGELSAAIDLELSDAENLLNKLRGARSDPVHAVHVISKALALASRMGPAPRLDDARAVERRLAIIRDPMSRTAFRAGFAHALALAAEYDEALVICERLIEDASRNALDFVNPHVFVTKAMCLAGNGSLAEALLLVNEAHRMAKNIRDEHTMLNSEAIAARILIAGRRFDEAIDLLVTPTDGAIRSMQAEHRATRALALALTDQLDQASTLIADARERSAGVEVRVLAAAVNVVAAIKTAPPLVPDSVRELIGVVEKTGNVDCLVTFYRALPEIGSHKLDDASVTFLCRLMHRVGDHALAEAIGTRVSERREGRLALTPREQEVADLLMRGFGNAQIAKQLFISPATAKLHVHHIFVKLGVRSRVEAVLRLSAEIRQATSAVWGVSDSNRVSILDAPNTNAGPDAVR